MDSALVDLSVLISNYLILNLSCFNYVKEKYNQKSFKLTLLLFHLLTIKFHNYEKVCLFISYLYFLYYSYLKLDR